MFSGLRFRRVILAYAWDRKQAYVSDAAKSQLCDAMICCRCTAVVSDNGEAERHVCLSRFFMAGEAGDVDYVPSGEYPIDPRARVRAANHAPLADLWPHEAKPHDPRRAPPLSERYEAMSLLLAEFSKMEMEIERNRQQLKKQPSARKRVRWVGWDRVKETP